MSKQFVGFGLMVLVLLTLVSCDLLPGGGGGAAATLLPELDGYNTIEGQSFTDALTTLGVMTTLAGQPELGAPIAAVSGVVSCYQEAGAVSARVYSDQSEPRNSGIVAVGDKKALLNPITFLQCVPGNRGPSAQSVTIQPCSHSYTLTRDDNEFYIIYAGLTADVCHAFCSNLEGCTAH
ncbi:MAG TPA: hypothetical protein PLD25_01240 [Chloroflexota bacterium]|nr:hypothetical protein [Chloroflexota bacterium]